MPSQRRTHLYLFLFPTLVAVAACQSLSKLDKLKFDGGTGSHESAQLPAADARDSGPRPQKPKDAAVDAAQDAGKDSGSDLCAIADGNECDPIRQCGCEPGNHCQVIGDDQRAKCRPIGTATAWGACKAASQCPEGQTCDRGSCRPYCKNDKGCDDGACVPLLGPDGEASKRYNVCWKHCDAKQSACAEGTSCRQLKTPRGEMGAFCAAAADPCPSVEDGKCDESKGTGACVDGTDKKDCCERAAGAACDPIGQCGCPAGSTCFFDTDTHQGACTVPITGQRTQGEHCSGVTDCKAGMACVGTLDVCTTYCNVNADCGAGRTCFKTTAVEIGFCLDSCSRGAATNKCAEGLVCATIPFPPGDFCWKPLDCAMLRRDGQCQEKTGFCAKGTDPEDCCEIPEGGSQCNPFQQCGCEDQPGTHCYGINDLTFQCRMGGMQKLGESCSNSAPCDDGAMCADKICRKVCEPDGPSCGNDQHCMPIHAVAQPDKGSLAWGACYEKCDFAMNNCPGETVCAKVSAQLQYCSIPMDPCPGGLIGDGKCDDTSPNGSRICALGTDSDCDTP